LVNPQTQHDKKEPNNIFKIKRGRDARVCCLRLPTYKIVNIFILKIPFGVVNFDTTVN